MIYLWIGSCTRGTWGLRTDGTVQVTEAEGNRFQCGICCNIPLGAAQSQWHGLLLWEAHQLKFYKKQFGAYLCQHYLRILSSLEGSRDLPPSKSMAFGWNLIESLVGFFSFFLSFFFFKSPGVAARETAQALKTLAQAARGVAASTSDPAAAHAMLDSARDVMEGSAMLIQEAKQALIAPGDAESQQRLAQVRPRTGS